jgi:transposase
MKIQVQIYLIVELFITIVESSLVLRRPEMYEDEIGYEKGEVQKRKIVETDTFSVDERITIISGIIAIIGNEEQEST